MENIKEYSTLCLMQTAQNQKKMTNLIFDLKKELEYQKKLQVKLEEGFQKALASAEQILNQRIEHKRIRK